MDLEGGWDFVWALLEACSVGGGMARIATFRSLAVALGAISMAVACGGGGGGGGQNLASDQTLSFPMVDDVGNLDPATMSAAVDIDIFRNTYSGLYKFDDQLNQVPDIASGPPTISSDGLTYTFKMRNNAKLANGDPLQAHDFIFDRNLDQVAHRDRRRPEGAADKVRIQRLQPDRLRQPEPYRRGRNPLQLRRAAEEAAHAPAFSPHHMDRLQLLRRRR